MLGFNCIRKVLPLAYNMTRVFPKHKNFLPAQLLCPSVNSLANKFYSQTAAPESDLIVDYDYVKTASNKSDTVIIDVREPDEIKENGRIPNSFNIPLGEVETAFTMTDQQFEATFKRPKPKEDTEIIFYCMIGKRSGKAFQSVQKLGFKNAKNYLGSWTDWAAKS